MSTDMWWRSGRWGIDPGLAGVQPDPDCQREGWISDRLLDKPLLEGDGSSDRGARRSEDDQRLVAAELEHLPPVDFDDGARHFGEASSEACSILVPPFLREGRPAADVGDQERVDVSVSAGVRLILRTA